MVRLDLEKRYEIYAYNRAGFSQKLIANMIGVSPSTISREIRRNSGKKGYRPKQAQRLADNRQSTKPKFKRFTEEIRAQIDKDIRKDWSPEQIVGRSKTCKKPMVSTERIYQYIWLDKANGGDLFSHLRRKGKKKKAYGGRDTRGQIKNRISIEKRPKIVDEKTEFGHWEIDLMVGSHHKGFLVTAVERITKQSLIGHSTKKDSNSIAKELIHILKPYKRLVKTITSDNGKEFAGHEEVAQSLSADFYFAHAYKSCERGLNENTNGLIRQYFPKGEDLRFLRKKQIQSVEEKLNNRPRKTLSYQTPQELFILEKTQIALVT